MLRKADVNKEIPQIKMQETILGGYGACSTRNLSHMDFFTIPQFALSEKSLLISKNNKQEVP
ncbi:MAG: hypothetical protein NWF00_02415 [Candidatus Bathyarchaeota archaeon]|nr:hypothetical protein [Candidatus Bathyarchaeota archaeon]